MLYTPLGIALHGYQLIIITFLTVAPLRRMNSYNLSNLLTAFNSHTGSAAMFHWSETLTQAAVSIALPTLDKLHLPVYYLPQGVNFNRIMLHPYSMNMFVLGEQLWMSADMGATFQVVLKPDSGTVSVCEVVDSFSYTCQLYA